MLRSDYCEASAVNLSYGNGSPCTMPASG